MSELPPTPPVLRRTNAISGAQGLDHIFRSSPDERFKLSIHVIIDELSRIERLLSTDQGLEDRFKDQLTQRLGSSDTNILKLVDDIINLTRPRYSSSPSPGSHSSSGGKKSKHRRNKRKRRTRRKKLGFFQSII